MPGSPTQKIAIFDFDGTIADSFTVFVQIINRLAREFGYPIVEPDQVQHFRNLRAQDIIRQSGVPPLKIPFLLRRLYKEFNREVQHLQPIAGMSETLQALKRQGNQLGIATSNAPENVAAFLKNQHLAEVFDFVESGITLFGKGRVIQQILQRRRLNLEAVVYVGDETRDIEAAQANQIPVVAVSWGFNSQQALAALHPNHLIHQPEELVTILSQSTQL